MTATTGQQDRSNQFIRRQFRTQQVIWPLIVLVLLVTVLLVALAYVFDRLREAEVFSPENSLPVALIVGTVVLLLSIAVIVIVFARLRLDTWKHALGLPEGSVRAIIALLLILLFFIVSIFLYADLAQPPDSRSLVGIDANRLAGIPTADIVGLAPNPDDPALVDVELRGVGNAASEDLAKQIVTTVSTLVVAIAAFYFGTKSVETAKRDPEPTRPGSETNRDGDGGDDADGADRGGQGTAAAGPAITRLVPPAVSTGTAPVGLTIIGTRFAEGATVTLGDGPPLDPIWVDESTLSMEIGAGLTTPTEVRVTNPDGSVSGPAQLDVRSTTDPNPDPEPDPEEVTS